MQKGSQRLSEESPSPVNMSAWLGFGICCFALATLSIAFCSPYWLQTWPMSENRFKNMGLWHVCFYNYMQFKDDSQQVYSACWWVFDPQPKYYKLREWLTPPWFITCQVLTTGSLMIEILVTIMTGMIFLHCCPLMNHEYLQTYAMFAAGSMMFLAAMILFVVGILFGYQVNDRYWLPRPDQNYLSWGFGFMVISMICALVAGILLFKAAWECYNALLQKEDDYTRRALEMSAAGIELGPYPANGADSGIVPPGFLNPHSGNAGSFVDKPLLEKESFGPSHKPPKYFDEQPSLSPTGAMSVPTSEEKVALMPKMRDPGFSPVKPEPERSFGRDPTLFGMAAAPPYSAGAFGRGFDPSRDFDDGFGAKSFDQAPTFGGGAAGKSFEQPPKYGKSFDRNFERRYSDSSDEDIGPAKPERQY